MRAVRIGGDLAGGSAQDSGVISTSGEVASVTLGGSLLGGSGLASGRISTGGALKEVRIGGDVKGGSASAGDLQRTGFIEAKRIGNLVIRGSLIAGVDNTAGVFANNGAIRVADDIASATIGNILGNSTTPATISARGSATPTAASDLAIDNLTLKGRVEFAQLLAGFDGNGIVANADAQIGSVNVGGDWIASSIAAGAVPGGDGFFGTGDDTKMAGGGVKDVPGLASKINSLSISGNVLGTLGGTDNFGVVAENVVAVKVGGTAIPLTPGTSNDDVLVGLTGDFKVNEL